MPEESYRRYLDGLLTKFTHGLCPDCAKKFFPGLEDEAPNPASAI